MSGAPGPMTRAARRAARLDATAQHLSRLSVPQDSGWLGRARTDALERLRTVGLPERRDEYWRFTDPSVLSAETAAPAEVFRITDEPVVFSDIDRLRIVFTDGVFDQQASDDLTAEGLEVTRLAEAAQADIHWAQDIYGKLEERGQQPVPRPLATLNSAMAHDGVLIRATGKVARPVSLIYRRQQEATDMVLHHVIRIEPGAEMTLLENGPAAARYSIVTEACIGAGGMLHHVRTQGRDHARSGITHLFVRMDKAAGLKSFTLSANGRVLRNEAMIWLDGEGGSAHVAGAAMGDGDFHHDDTVFIDHAAPRCESRQVFKKVLRNGAVGVFQGKILVQRPAQLTDGYQISQSLLMDERSQFLAKPELEIYADDVKCSHGSTSGEIDADHLFYLRSRGVPEAEGKNLLVLAFLTEALEEIARDDLAEDVRSRLESWLGRHRR